MYDQLPKVTVIFPTLNEANNIPLIFPYIPMDLVSEVIVVDGRSTDGTVDVAREYLPSVKIVMEKKPGKGAAMRAGYKAATGDILMVIDADGSNDPREISRYIRALLEGADFVKGSRFAHNGGTTDMPRYRKAGNAVFTHMVNTLFDTGFTDLCYGYHAFWRYCLDVMDLEDIDGFEIDTALYIRAVRERLRIAEVPSFEGYRFYGEGKLKTIPDGWRVLTTIGREWWSHMRTTQKQDYLGFRGTSQAQQVLAPGDAAAGYFGGVNWQSTMNNLAQTQANRQLMQIMLRMLSAENNLRSTLQNILRLTLESVGAASASLMVLNDDGGLADGCLLYNGQTQPLQNRQLDDVVEHGLAGWVLKHRQPALVASTRDDPRWLCRGWEDDEYEGSNRSALGVPIMASERVVGVLTLVRPEPHQFAEADLELVAKHAMGA